MQTNEYNLLTLFADGGFMMYPLVLCSLVALGVIIAKAYTLYQAHAKSRELLAQVEGLGREGRLAEAVALAEETPGPVAAILVSGLRRVLQQRATGREIEQAIRTTGKIELGFLERGLAILATLSNVAPLLGFLGTVIGMISAFAAIEEAGQVEASLVAGGIKVALITTATGLLIAIPINIGYNFFVTRIDKLIVDMEEGTWSVLNTIWRLNTDSSGILLVDEGASRPSPVRSEPAHTIHDTEPAEPGIPREGRDQDLSGT
ncbi:MAG TPA: MotA/TolQ/ExbB proton channel family protein [Longimicrobiales bacterium]|nr:MotA/TolQ/ExbB proton channel family protein [Longimicrobiales bacterium]